MGQSLQQLRGGAGLDDVALGNGYESHSGFRDAFARAFGIPPGQSAGADCVRLTWLQSRLPVPAVEAFASTDTHTYLLLSEIPGLMACDPAFASNVTPVVRALAEGMLMLHSLDITNCPFDQRLDTQISLARLRAEHDLVDTSDFDEARQGSRLLAN